MQKAYRSAAIAKEYFDHLLSLPLNEIDSRKVNATQISWIRLELSRQVLEMEINGKLPQYQLEVKIAQLELEKTMTEKIIG